MPFELQEEWVASDRGVSPDKWDEYDNERKGQIIAASILKSWLATIERFYRELESAKNKAK